MPNRDRKDLDLLAWITDAEGNMIPEYHSTKEGRAFICWIPSKEGTRFAVNWSGRNKNPEYKPLDIQCQIWLDGRAAGAYVLTAKERAKMPYDSIDFSILRNGERRAFEFGKLALTDDHTNARAVSPDDLNVITIKLNWGKSRPRASTKKANTSLPNDGPISEQKVKNGNLSSAGLGRLVPYEDVSNFSFRADRRISPLIFYFHHASVDWLKAEGYIPCSLHPEAPELEPLGDFEPQPSTSSHNRAQKKPHPASDPEQNCTCPDVDVLDDSESKPGELEPMQGVEPTDLASNHGQAQQQHRPESDYIDVDGFSDSESEIATPKLEPLEDIKALTSASRYAWTRKSSRPEAHIDVNGFSDSETKPRAVTAKLEREDTKPPTLASSSARTQKRHRPPPHIDIDALSDSEFKSVDIKSEPIDIKRKPRRSKFKPSTMVDTSNGEPIDNEVVFLGCFQVTRTEVQPRGPKSNKRLKSEDTKPKQELA